MGILGKMVKRYIYRNAYVLKNFKIEMFFIRYIYREKDIS